VAQSDHRIVLDTNIVLRAFINLSSESGRIIKACEERRVVPLISRTVLVEYRFVLADPQLLSRYPQLNLPEVAVALERLLYVADIYRRVTERFIFPRDPKDAKLIELALAGRATQLISTDEDLLDLPNGRDDAARRFRQRLPGIEVMTPNEFSRRYGKALGID
jgi:putative PIN family toxin of toxin-antitoxin system